ncbi:MAG TPA: DUF1737 domain-containing protein [Urbifossiella sp.]|nr:DUF1737 domain-containing protein [Urbifossiella sp.]
MVYVILEETDALRLAAEVSRHLAQGWTAQGGVACYFDPLNQNVRYVQAVVRGPAPRPTS